MFQLAAKTQDLHVDAAIEDVLVDPRRLQEMLAAERALGSVQEGDEQRIFAFGQRDLGAGRGGEAARAEAQPPPAELVAAAFVVARGNRARPVQPPQHRTHAGEKLPQVERFRHVIVGAELEADDAVDLIATVAGCDDDRHVATRSELAQQVETVLEAEPKIQNDDADFVRGKLTDHLLAARRRQRPDVVVGEIV